MEECQGFIYTLDFYFSQFTIHTVDGARNTANQLVHTAIKNGLLYFLFMSGVHLNKICFILNRVGTLFSGVTKLLTPFVIIFNKQMEEKIKQENEIYVQQLQELVKHFSSIEDYKMREIIVTVIKLILTEVKH
jgi:hypothetical protein